MFMDMTVIFISSSRKSFRKRWTMTLRRSRLLLLILKLRVKMGSLTLESALNHFCRSQSRIMLAVALRYGARNRTITPARTWSIFYATVRNIYYVASYTIGELLSLMSLRGGTSNSMISRIYVEDWSDYLDQKK